MNGLTGTVANLYNTLEPDLKITIAKGKYFEATAQLISANASAERVGVGEFVIAVAEFDAAHVQLKPLGDGDWSRDTHASQRGLRSGIIVEERRPIVAQVRLDSFGQ